MEVAEVVSYLKKQRRRLNKRQSLNFDRCYPNNKSILGNVAPLAGAVFKMRQTRPLFVYSRPLHNTMINTVQCDYRWKKRRWCAWDSNPRRQDGRQQTNPLRYEAPFD